MPKLTPLLMSMLLFGGCILGVGAYLNGIQDIYTPIGEIEQDIFYNFTSVLNRTDDATARLLNNTAGFTKKGVLDWTKYYDASLIFLGVLGIIAEFPGMAISMANMALSFLPVPEWFGAMIGSMIVVLFVMIIAAIALKRDEM